MNHIEKLINHFSNKELEGFFFNKIPTFKPETDMLLMGVAENSNFETPTKIGEATLENQDELLIFTCRFDKELGRRSAKRKQFDIAKQVLKEDFKDGAIFVFYDGAGNFRLSFIRRYYGKDQKYSNWRRFTYFVQPSKENKTFKHQLDNCSFASLDDIEKAFGVEALSKEFYTQLSYWYFASVGEVKFPKKENENQQQVNSQAMIRLITRMMFVWFMKQKGLIPDEIFNKQYIDEILNFEDKTESTYYKAILQNLFFATLNTEMGKDRKWVTSSAYGVQHFYRYRRFFKDETADQFLNLMQNIPFLNGGLFENLDTVQTGDPNKGIEKKEVRVDCFSDNIRNEGMLKVPDNLFFGTRTADISTFLDDKRKNNVEITGLIDLLERYDFTIDENSPNDQEVALDPELLGTVFENLLASYNPETQSTARKESGSFYTPRPIVDYMVKESLFYHLKEKTKISEERLRTLLEGENSKGLTAEEGQRIVESLTHIKILDPACGSGAFPVGTLQKMVRILNLLDPENEIFKEKLQQKLKDDLQRTIDKSNFEELKNNIEEIFANRMNDPDYARKLFLIQNCLYGVDIQPIAMQITKLRFFISLLVEQQINPEEPNFGIKPLPNLETKFVAANTLLGLKDKLGKGSAQQLSFKDPDLEQLENDLAEVREKYFNARTFVTKRKYRALDKEIREKIATLLVNDGWGNESAKQIANWDPFNQNVTSSWFDPEWMFGVTGFDLVMGNPPYIQLSKSISSVSKLKFADFYKEQLYETFERTGDIYCLFYERGLSLTNGTGLLCYITSNKWMRANYGKSLRKYFSTKEPIQLIDLGPGIFESATVDTNILLIRGRKTQEHSLKAVTLKDKRQIEKPEGLNFLTMKGLSEESWVILSPIERSIKEKIERIGTPLKDWDIRINRGILTGFNQAFIISEEKRNELIREDPKSAEIIRPILRGRDIKRYGYNFADLYLINSHNGYTDSSGSQVDRIHIEEYPAIKRHLDQYWNKLKKRYDKGDTPYNLRHCAYLEDFSTQKICYIEIMTDNPSEGYDFPSFCFDSNNCMVLNTAYIMAGEGDDLKQIIAVLNSKVGKVLVKNYVTQLSQRQYRMLAQYVANFPIPKVRLKTIVEAFDKIVQNQTKKAQAEELMQRIDKALYYLYGFSSKEIAFIDAQ